MKACLLILLFFSSSCLDQSRRSEVQQLFNGRDLSSWKVSNFGGEGEVRVADGAIQLGYGYPITGITWVGEPLPKDYYAIEFEATKKTGNDFFVGLTFPVREDHCSLILGGWGGMTCGLSSFDYKDAASNETTTLIDFEKDRWYKIRMEVAGDNLRAFVDDKKIIDTFIENRKVHTRAEVEVSKPLGLCAFETMTAYKNLYLYQIAK